MSIFSVIFGKRNKDYLFNSSKYMDLDGRLNPYFIEDEWYIFPDRESDLGRLISFMKSNPRMKVELNFHSDNSASNQDNQLVRQIRVNEAIDYFVSEGIEKTKVICSNFRYASLPCFRVIFTHRN